MTQAVGGCLYVLSPLSTVKLAFIAFQIAPSDADLPGSLPTDFAALKVSDPILASVLLLIPSLLTNAIGEFNLSPADHLICMLEHEL